MARTSWFDSVLLVVARAHAQREFRRFLRATHRAAATQERVLRRTLAENAASDFGRAHHFSRIRSYRDFVSHVPICRYETLQPYIEQALAGRTQALLGPRQKLLMFAMTSGSTDHPKHIPITRSFVKQYRRGWNIFGFKALLDHPQALLRTILQISSPMDEHLAACGVPCGSISGLLANTQQRLVRRYYATPARVHRIGDPTARYYTIMRLAVPQAIGWIVTASPATILKLARLAASESDRLIRDIHDGTLRPPGDLPAEHRQALQPWCRANPSAARRLAWLAQQHGELLPRHYWNLSFLAHWTGGTMGFHLHDFPRYFGSLPSRDIGLMATEGRITIPLEDGTPAGVLDVQGSFFEFVDADAPPDAPSAVHPCHELSEGKDYRVILTNATGLCRYDLGDHVRVRGYAGQAPILEFLHRGAHVSSITGEKLTEWQVVTAFSRACEQLSMAPRPFVFAPVWDTIPYYRLHIEEGTPNTMSLAQAMDQQLRRLNVEYASKRSSDRLGNIVVYSQPTTRWRAWLRRREQDHRGTIEQYKQQYLYPRPGDDADLCPAGKNHRGLTV